MCEWLQKEPQLFGKDVHNLAGGDSYVAVYSWDERAQSGQLLLSSQRRLAKQRETPIGSLRFSDGSYRLIALAYTKNASANIQLNTSLSKDELGFLLKQLRSATFSKVERHWLIDAAP